MRTFGTGPGWGVDGVLGLGDGVLGLGDGVPGLGDGVPGLGDAVLGLGDGVGVQMTIFPSFWYTHPVGVVMVAGCRENHCETPQAIAPPTVVTIVRAAVAHVPMFDEQKVLIAARNPAITAGNALPLGSVQFTGLFSV